MSEPSQPDPSETAAIAAAIVLWSRSQTPRRSARPGAWSLAMRLPDLEIDDLRAFARGGGEDACSTRF